ncbi:AI-2E family transporter [Halorhodospira abdelmalekii]|uniref:AI-2E family transporter n=1 Tax=Halorhodospira abdelmalekii TaxID=421629 RepID=UPI00190338B0|nr:AI-2E family transporter [Halorhodospira abdelmalekii]MBK1734125.1 AI-2E family transporter [Halorhodospira abdelmalekii]
MELIRNWLKRTFDDPQIVAFSVLLLVGLFALMALGGMLAPVIAALVIAYLLEGLVRFFERVGVPRLLAVTVVILFLTTFLVLVLFALVPLLYRQVAQLVDQLPAILTQGQMLVLQLPERYPQLFSESQVREMLDAARREITDWGQRAVTSVTVQSLLVLGTLIIYAILVPFLVFFFLKDKDKLLRWVTNHLPRHRALASEVWGEVDLQIGNYVRGKFIEILIVWLVTYITFSLLGLQFAMLLAVATGLSVIIPYLGAFAVTLPVTLIAYFQFGISDQFFYVVVAYLIIQALDGNVLVPLLFSEVVDLHPVAIISSILVFGGLWGFWGVFFAIPLATFVQAIIKAWVRRRPPPDEGVGEAEVAR